MLKLIQVLISALCGLVLYSLVGSVEFLKTNGTSLHFRGGMGAHETEDGRHIALYQ